MEKTTYEIFFTDQRLWISDRNLYTYPDIMVLEKPIDLENRTDTVMNPCLIAEVYEDIEFIKASD